jgi:subtilisin family serine protease
MHAHRATVRLSLAALLALAACSDQSNPASPEAAAPAQARTADGQPIPTRAQERPGTWVERTDAQLWAAISASDGVAVVGLKSPAAVRGVYRGRVLVGRSEWSQGRGAVVAQPGVTLLSADDLLPTLEVRIGGPASLAALRRLPFVDYVEPTMVDDGMQDFASVGGCGWGSTWTGDRQYTASGDIYSQKLTAMGIPSAWTLSSGAGVTIGITDTGISSGQGQFTSYFATGESTGRTLKLLKVSSQASVYDSCGHGTRMSGIIAAPRDGRSVGGIAYRSNLVSVRHGDGVAAVSSSDAKAGVRLAAQNGARVVVMAWESLNWFWQVSDEIEYWHYGSPILFFGAAGTSGCGDGILDSNVVFPADMPEVVAVTGITYPGGGVPCGIHRGSDVELTAYLDVPSTGQYTADVVGMGGSSNATAVVGSVAALVWSRNPTMTRDAVRARLHQTAAFYPSRHSEQGYGLIDAYRAVSGN